MTLEEKAAEAAANAVCTRCDNRLIPPGGVVPRVTTGTYRLVGLKGVRHFNLCWWCAPEFTKFLASARGYQ